MENIGDFIGSRFGLVGLCVLLSLHLLLKTGEFLWAIREKNQTLSEHTIQELIKAVQANTVATQHLDQRLLQIERSVAADLPKFKVDIRRFYAAIKEVAGADWPRIRDEIMRDEVTQ